MRWPKSVTAISVLLTDNFNLFSAISILLTAISICSQQPFQIIDGNFNLLAAISIYSQQFLLFHGNAHGIFRLPHHLSTTGADSGHQKSKRKIKSRYLKKIFKVKSENQTSSSDLRHGSWLHFGLLSFFLVLSAISFHFYLNICA